MRSLLFVPGDQERKLIKARGTEADVLIVDLEDSVAAANKDAARRIAGGFIRSVRQEATRQKIYVRINDLQSGLADGDLSAVLAALPDGIVLPKAVGSADVTHLAAKLRVHEAEAGRTDGTTEIIAIATETPAALLTAASFRGTQPRLAGLTWGAEDLSAAVGARTSRDQDGRLTDVFRLARATTLLAAAAAQTAAIDTVFVDFRDGEALRRECLAAERDGFVGKLAIHPDQVAIINAAFTPSPEAVAEAEAVVAAFAAAGQAGAVGVGGKMYDRPHLARAQRLLARAARGRTPD